MTPEQKPAPDVAGKTNKTEDDLRKPPTQDDLPRSTPTNAAQTMRVSIYMNIADRTKWTDTYMGGSNKKTVHVL